MDDFQCGHPVCPEVTKFKMIDGPEYQGAKEKVVQAAAGLTFSLVLTEGGRGMDHVLVLRPSFNIQ